MNANQRIQNIFEKQYSPDFLNIDFKNQSLEDIIEALRRNDVLVLGFDNEFTYKYSDYHYDVTETSRIQILNYMSRVSNSEIENNENLIFDNYDFEIEKYLQVKAIIEYLMPPYSRISWGYKIAEENNENIESYYRLCFQKEARAFKESVRFRAAFLPTLDPFDDPVFKESLVESINKISNIGITIENIKENDMLHLKNQLQIISY